MGLWATFLHYTMNMQTKNIPQSGLFSLYQEKEAKFKHTTTTLHHFDLY